MSHEVKIHDAQTKVLRELLFVPRVNFAGLVKITGLDGDHAKFHIKRLVELGYVDKKDGGYRLSIKGKEYANKLDTDDNTFERQPKTACLMLIKNPTTGKFVVQERLKNPFFGFVGFPTGKVRWGETVSQTAAREAEEETGLITMPADWQWRGTLHEMVRHSDTGDIVEDKIFYVMYNDKYSGDMSPDFEGGRNEWMTLDELSNNPKRHETSMTMAAGAEKNIGLVDVVTQCGDEF